MIRGHGNPENNVQGARQGKKKSFQPCAADATRSAFHRGPRRGRRGQNDKEKGGEEGKDKK